MNLKKENWNQEAFMTPGFAKERFNWIKGIVAEAIRRNVAMSKEYLHPVALKQADNNQGNNSDYTQEQTQEQQSDKERTDSSGPVYAGDRHIFRGLSAITVGSVTIVAIGGLCSIALLLYLLVMKVSVRMNQSKEHSQENNNPDVSMNEDMDENGGINMNAGMNMSNTTIES